MSKLKDLTPNPKNPRKISDKQLTMLKKSLDEYGDLSGVIFNRRTAHLVGGHQRTKIFPPDSEIIIEKSYKRPTKRGTVAVGYVEVSGEKMAYREVDWSKRREKEANIAANKHSGEWDNPILADWLTELNDGVFDIDKIGFSRMELSKVIGPLSHGADDDIPKIKKSICKLGDLWSLGEHRIFCGDCTVEKNIKKLMNGKADIVFTDPPYGINANKMTLGTGSKGFRRGGDWDSKRPDIVPLLKFGTHHVVWGGNYFTDVLPVTNNWICWHKKNDGLSFSEFELAHTSVSKNTRIFSHHWGGEKKDHPTQKPIAVMEWALNLSDSVKVFDPFLGSGSTLIACEKTKRKCYGMEIDPHYCDVTIKRWENYTGQKAKKLK